MYTIEDVRGQFNIEGPIQIKKYHNEAPVGMEEEICYQQENGTAYQFPDELCHTPITYMYSQDGYLVIELECDDEY